jgi:hypothetical protein
VSNVRSTCEGATVVSVNAGGVEESIVAMRSGERKAALSSDARSGAANDIGRSPLSVTARTSWNQRGSVIWM